jgi:hypothetical protein
MRKWCIYEHYFASKSFAVVREAFSKVYHDKTVPIKTTLRRLLTNTVVVRAVF